MKFKFIIFGGYYEIQNDFRKFTHYFNLLEFFFLESKKDFFKRLDFA